MRHTGAGLAIPDFPLAFGRLVPPLEAAPVVLHFAHRVFALVVIALLVRLLLRALRSGEPRLAMPALAAAVLSVVQAGLGGLTVLTARAVVPTTTHVASGAALLGLTFFVTLRAFRLLRAPEPLPAPALRSPATLA
jgi:cytochrome c oxidase assembly protein subunit 15